MADKALEWTNTKVQELLTKIKAEADKNNTFSGSQQEFDAINKQRAEKMLPPLIKQLRGIKAAGKALQAIEKFATEHPKWTNFIIGTLVAASRLVALPGSGIIVGLLLRSAVGVIKGEDIQQAVATAAKVATVGALAGAAIGEIGDALSDNSDQIAGALDQAGDAGGDAADAAAGSAGDAGAAEMAQQAIDNHKDTLMQGRALGIPDEYKLSFNNGKLSVSSQELLDALNGPDSDAVLGALRANELSEIQVDDWLPDGRSLSPRVVEFKIRIIDMLDNIRAARRG
jgi:hypothetical protein